ncbi:Hypothetical predicted protein [Mytilus galloprovincialis]|uniref:Mab-21-like HhH/H2TH-like domain-containing protein n=1 Tax=Mytilus galloprovincialis TaxID=29158 RepID=A0A8B6G7J4_MYTGA|nr:Hypothetical predicted protein [Mytilus galloprovincialis]
MKIILKDFIKPRHGDLLCSYFLKTIMFWLSEEINPSEWKPENMISCLSDCIRRLIYYVEYKTCLHYFIPENNLFEDRFTDKEHKELINTLRFIYESPFISVLDTSTFQNYRLESLNSRGMILSASELPCYSYLRVFRQNIMFNSESIYRAIKHLGNVCVHKELRTYIFSTDARKRLQSSNHCNMMARNKLFYQQYRRTLYYLKISLRSESISPWLLLASLFYKCKRFLECLYIINCGISSFSPEKIHLHPANSLAEQTVFNEMKQKCGLINALKHLVIDNVYFRYPYSLLPDELGHFKFDREVIPISPDEYSYFLQILCCVQLGDDRGAQNALHDFELTNK